MAVIKCKMCGGTIDVTPGVTIGTCEYCGSKQTLPKACDEAITNLFNRANNLRLKCEFDKAEQIYEKIVQQDDTEAEAHWGIILCKYGVEYVEDPLTMRRIPTCHRTSFEGIRSDADYQAAIDYSDVLQQGVYENEAREIDKLQKDILALVRNEKPFDVFICYKETDENGRRTVESTLANDIYYQLTQRGLKVFYAAITLEDKLGHEYEPYIFAALNSSKVMLVLGTKPENFTSVWVKNEWSRFMHFMKTDRNKLLIPCYRDMDAYDLPDEFAHLQAQDMSRIGFLQDIIRGVEKVVGKETKVGAFSSQINVAAGPSTKALLKRGYILLEDADWGKAKEIFDQVLNMDAECADAYLGMFMADYRMKDISSLEKALLDPTIESRINTNKDFQRMLKYDNGEMSGSAKNLILKMEKRVNADGLNEDKVTSNPILANSNNDQDEVGSKDGIILISDNTVRLDGFKGENEWLIIAKERNYWLLLSKYCQGTSIITKEPKYSWETSEVRDYLNHDFINNFTEFQRNCIVPGTVTGNKYALIADRVFLLSEEELYEYGNKMEPRGLAWKDPSLKLKWVLRTGSGNTISIVNKYGSANKTRIKTIYLGEMAFGIRPAIWIDATKVEGLQGVENAANHETPSPLVVDHSIQADEQVSLIKNRHLSDIVIKGNEVILENFNGKNEWIVINRNGNNWLLISKYMQEYREVQKYIPYIWEESAIKEYLNAEFISRFTDNQRARLQVPKQCGTSDVSEKIFLMSDEEYNTYFPSKEDDRRIMKRKEGMIPEIWALRSMDKKGRIQFVTKDGYINSKDGNSLIGGVSLFGIRPMIWLNVDN